MVEDCEAVTHREGVLLAAREFETQGNHCDSGQARETLGGPLDRTLICHPSGVKQKAEWKPGRRSTRLAKPGS